MNFILKLSFLSILLNTFCTRASSNEEFPLHNAAKENNITKIKNLLKDPNIKIDAENEAGNTALYVSIQEEQYEAAECLLKHGASVDYANAESSTPLQRAALSGNYKIIEILLQYNANPNKQNKFGDTALHIASKPPTNTQLNIKAQIENIKLLLKYGADKTIKNYNNPKETAADIAEHEDIKNVLNAKEDKIKKPQFKRVFLLTLQPPIEKPKTIKKNEELHPGSRILYFTVGLCFGFAAGIIFSACSWYIYKKLFHSHFTLPSAHLMHNIKSFTAEQPLILALQQVL